MRSASLTYGRHVVVELSAADGRQLFVPIGVAHGFCTLEPDTEIVYKVLALYSAAHEGGLAWDDPNLRIAWSVAAADAVLAETNRR
jgi:dTDP-4-dehydrorhamnose 3,5-epimerase